MSENGFPADREDFQRWYQDPLKKVILELVDRVFNEKAFKDGGIEELRRFYREDLSSNDPSHGALEPGLGAVLKLLTLLESAFPGFRYHVKAMVREGQTVAIHWETQGVHRGSFMGFKPKEPRSFVLQGMAICRFAEDERIEHIEQIYDNMGLFDQLGIPNQAAVSLVAEAVPEMGHLREELRDGRKSFKLADHLDPDEDEGEA